MGDCCKINEHVDKTVYFNEFVFTQLLLGRYAGGDIVRFECGVSFSRARRYDRVN